MIVRESKFMSETSSEDIPLRGAQQMIAEKMHKSLMQAAQLTHHTQCSAFAFEQRRATIHDTGGKASVQDLVNHYLVSTLVEHPMFNATFENNTIRLHKAVHLSIAMSLDDGMLVAPALFDTQEMTLKRLSDERRELAVRARAGKLSVREMTGGTCTVSNLGLSRVKYFTPILNIPQVAIIGIGAIEQRLIKAEDGQIENYPFLNLSLTFDHRVVNGAPAAAFLDALCSRIERAPAVP